MADAQYTADVEIFSGCMRVYVVGQGYASFDPFEFGCSLHWINPSEVEIKAVSQLGESPVKYRRAMCDALKRLGVSAMRWTRKTSTGEYAIRMDTGTGKLIR